MTSAAAGNLDVWSWTSKKVDDLDLATMVALKGHVLCDKESRRDLAKKIETLGAAPDGDDAVKAAIGHWLMGAYAKAAPLLASTKTAGAAAFAQAECCLFGGQSSLDGQVSSPTKAVEILKNMKPQTGAVLCLLMRCLVQLENWDEAESTLAATPKSFRDSSDGRYFAARLVEASGRREAAADAYEAILGDDADHASTLFRLALLYDFAGEDRKAMTLYESLVEQPSPPVNALMNLGVLYEDQDRAADAAYCYRRVLSIYPQHPRARLFLKDAEASLNMFYDEEQEVRLDKKNQILKIPVSDFELSVRSRNCLAKMNIVTLGDLVEKSEAELLTYKNFGETSLNEIKQILDAKGLRLGMRPEDDLMPVVPVPTQRRQSSQPAFDLDPNDDRLRKSVSEMSLSVRARKCLSNLNIKSIGDLVVMTADELLSQRNFGVTSLKEIIEQLTVMGLSLRTVDK